MLKHSRPPIFIFSGKNGQPRRVSLTSIIMGGALFSILLIVLTSFASFVGFSYYYEHNALAHVSAQPLISPEARDRVLRKFEQLEAELRQDEQLAANMEAQSGGVAELQVGIGPVSRSDAKSVLSNGALHQDGKQVLSHNDKSDLWTGAPSEDDGFLKLLGDRINNYKNRHRALEERINHLYMLNEGKVRYSLATPDRWPLKGWITSGFGFRHSPIRGGGQFHAGLDIASPMGTAVDAPSDGKVVFSGWKGGYGNTVIIDHGFGLQTLYGHNSKLFVREGDTVTRGMRIATVGMTGNTTGPHLHYEVHVDGVPTNPLNFITDFME